MVLYKSQAAASMQKYSNIMKRRWNLCLFKQSLNMRNVCLGQGQIKWPVSMGVGWVVLASSIITRQQTNWQIWAGHRYMINMIKIYSRLIGRKAKKPANTIIPVVLQLVLYKNHDNRRRLPIRQRNWGMKLGRRCKKYFWTCLNRLDCTRMGHSMPLANSDQK